jgi:hypothetical protein
MTTRAERTFHLHLNAPPAVTFPLFGPKRETLWAPEWAPRFVYPEDGEVGPEGAVFLVDADDERPESTWILTQYDESQGRIAYVYVAPGHNVTQLWIVVAPDGDQASAVSVTYRRTSLSAAGDAFVANFVQTYEAMGREWETAINSYLAST